MSTEQITVLIVDDHAIVREGLRSCLASQPHIRILDEASNGIEAIEKAISLKPDVILLDLSMPVLSGLDAALSLRRKLPATKILILSIHNSKEYVSRIVKAGADGFVLKDSEPSEIVKAIEAVHHGDAFFSPSISKTILEGLKEKKKEEDKLSHREREILILIAEGLSSSEIAKHLCISERTVGTHRERIMKKLNIHTVAGLTKYAVARGYINAR